MQKFSDPQQLEVTKCRISENCWRVERLDHDGGIEVTAFYGNHPYARAKAYAKLLEF